MSKALEAALDDVEARFICNLPLGELKQPERLFFQIEQAYWFYEDFKADQNKELPHFRNLKSFATKLFKHSSILAQVADKFQELFSIFTQYKSKIPVFGCILLNKKLSKVLLVQDYGTKSWTFPRGKINENESEFDCAIREVLEETGFDARSYCQEEDNLMIYQDGKMIKLFIGTNISENTVFQTHTRKEIADIKFFPLDSLPTKAFGLLPFLSKLKRWISIKQRNNGKNLLKSPSPSVKLSPNLQGVDINNVNITNENSKKKNGNKPLMAHPSPNTTRRLKNLFDQRNKDTFDLNENGKNSTGWGVADMFLTNSKITGRNYDYNGNPHEFGSFHPRYVNYNNLNTNQPGDNNSTENMKFLDFPDISSKNDKLMNVEDFKLPMSNFFNGKKETYSDISVGNSNYVWKSKKLQIPFKFDKKKILATVNALI